MSVSGVAVDMLSRKPDSSLSFADSVDLDSDGLSRGTDCTRGEPLNRGPGSAGASLKRRSTDAVPHTLGAARASSGMNSNRWPRATW